MLALCACGLLIRLAGLRMLCIGSGFGLLQWLLGSRFGFCLRGACCLCAYGVGLSLIS